MQSKSDLERLESELLARFRRGKILQRMQICLLIVCYSAIAAALALKVSGTYPAYVIPLGIVGMISGFGSLLPGRMAKPIIAEAAAVVETLNRQEAVENIKQVAQEPQTRIPLTIGFANLSGDDLSDLVAKDSAALAGIFSQTKISAPHQIPAAEVLFVYAHLNEDGTIRGASKSGIRQVVELTNAAIIVLASPNTKTSLQRAATLPGQKSANIVFTLDRSDAGFGRFFRELFRRMRDGKDMLAAWVELAPQGSAGDSASNPQLVLLAEGDKIRFPS